MPPRKSRLKPKYFKRKADVSVFLDMECCDGCSCVNWVTRSTTIRPLHLIMRILPPRIPNSSSQKISLCTIVFLKYEQLYLLAIPPNIPQHKNISVHLGIARLEGGGSKLLPGWFVAPIFRRNVHVQTGICMILPENRCPRVPI